MAGTHEKTLSKKKGGKRVSGGAAETWPWWEKKIEKEFDEKKILQERGGLNRIDRLKGFTFHQGDTAESAKRKKGIPAEGGGKSVERTKSQKEGRNNLVGGATLLQKGAFKAKRGLLYMGKILDCQRGRLKIGRETPGLLFKKGVPATPT